MTEFDADTATFLEAATAPGGQPLRSLSITDARRVVAAMAPPPGNGSKVVDAVDRMAGRVPVRIYRPTRPGTPSATVLLLHGGGWALGSIDTHDAMARAIAERAHACVVSVDYRLAPEHPFPAGFDDCCEALRWAEGSRPALGGASTPLVVIGDSAGGNLAAAICQWARDTNGPHVDLQILLYPVLDADSESDFWSRAAHGEDTRLLSRKDLAWFADMYLTDGHDRSDPYVSPLRAETFDGLPRALIITAGFDLLCDEGRAYHDALIAAGSASDYHCFEGTIHGFASFPEQIEAGFEALALITATVRGPQDC